MRRDQFLNRLSSLGGKPSEQDRADSFELAVSARRFSRRTQAVLDDKLSFSATLMRAGEVEAANRLLAEVGEEVLTEEVALLERVNEVKAARSVGERDKVTRGRLARTLAVAMLGASLFAFSAAGAAVVGLFRDDDQAAHGSEPDAAQIVADADRVKGARHVRILDNLSLRMTAGQFREYSQLTEGNIDEAELQTFLLELLPPNLAEKVRYALVSGLDLLPAPISEEVVAAAERFPSARNSNSDTDERKDEQPVADETEEPKEEEPTPKPSETPRDEETPGPEESPEDQQNLPIFGGDEG